MRDLGLMGESTFSLWCADVGLISNGSQIDKTGWDFFVEFPFASTLAPIEIHKAAFECKVQVKATDKSDRKVPVALSNLRRLITAQMPAFFVFIEFDRKESAQQAYVVHVDNDLISKVLKRLHEIEQSDNDNNFNKRKMTIHYDDRHLLEMPNGSSLKRCLLRYIGSDVSEYIALKKSHLETTGYENGFAQITFSTEGEENLKTLVDVSLGIKEDVEISRFKGTDTRFGILSSSPSFDSDGAKLAMPNLKPTAEGKIRFKEDRLSAGLSFECKFYNSPFNLVVPDEIKKMRVEGEFFDLIFNPFTGAASYSFSLGEGIRLELKKFRSAIKLIDLLSVSGKKVFAELLVDGYPKLEFGVGCSEKGFSFAGKLRALDSAIKIMEYFEVNDLVDISLDEISKYEAQICQMEAMLNSSPRLFRIEFGVDGEGYDSSKETACIFLTKIPIGSHFFGAILVFTGKVEGLEDDKYRLIAEEMVVEQKIVSEKGDWISDKDLIAAMDSVEEKYGDDFFIVTMFDKRVNTKR